MPPSQVWQYFNKSEKGKKVKCTICKNEFMFCGSTSAMATHLKKIHKINIAKQASNVPDNTQADVEISEEEYCAHQV